MGYVVTVTLDIALEQAMDACVAKNQSYENRSRLVREALRAFPPIRAELEAMKDD
jgi:Arc/MetJ-type ribon-helix-helix transcriptional regulator